MKTFRQPPISYSWPPIAPDDPDDGRAHVLTDHAPPVPGKPDAVDGETMQAAIKRQQRKAGLT